MNNSIGPRGKLPSTLKELLEKKRPDLKLKLWDERLSTVGAERTLLEAGARKKKKTR